MATPTIADARLLAAGAKKATTWGTAVALGAGAGLLIEDDGGLSRSQPYVPDKAIDTPFVKDGDLGPIEPVDFSPAFSMRYDPGALGTLIAMLFGTAGAPTKNETTTTWAASTAYSLNDLVEPTTPNGYMYECTTAGTSGAAEPIWPTTPGETVNDGTVVWTCRNIPYKHILQWKDSIDGLFATFAIEKPGKIYEVASAKPYALALNITDGMLKGTISLRGNTIIDDSAVNGATQMDALTYADRENRVKFIQGSIKMNDESGGDVSSETALRVNGITLNFSRPLDAEHKAGDATILEPLENDVPVVSVELSFPRMDATNAAFFAKFTGETEQKMLIKFTGALIGGTSNFDLALYFPRLRITAIGNPVAIGSVVPASLTLQAEEAASAPTGMSYARLYAELINKQSTDYLA